MRVREALLWVLAASVGLLILYLGGFTVAEERDQVILMTASRVETNTFMFHDSILLDAINLKPGTAHRVEVLDHNSKLVVDLDVLTDQRGRISEAVIWYDIGELPYHILESQFPEGADLTEQQMCDLSYAETKFDLNLYEGETTVYEMTFEVTADDPRPILYASDSRGIHKPGFLIGEEDVYVVGKFFPSGTFIRVWAVPAQSEWDDSDPLNDVTSQYSGNPPVFELKAGEHEFKRVLWERETSSVGSYDIVAEIISYKQGSDGNLVEEVIERLVSYSTISGFVVQRRPEAGEPLAEEIAGASLSPFVHRDVFTIDETVYVGVNPTTQQEKKLIGETVYAYIIPNTLKGDLADGEALALLDVRTGTVPTPVLVQDVCENCWKTPAWSRPEPGEYDVVLDRGGTGEGFYDDGEDLWDSPYEAGFTVLAESPKVTITIVNIDGQQQLIKQGLQWPTAHVGVQVTEGQYSTPFKIELELETSEDVRVGIREGEGTLKSCPVSGLYGAFLSLPAQNSMLLERWKPVSIKGTIANASYVTSSNCYQILTLSFPQGMVGQFDVQADGFDTPKEVKNTNELRIAIVLVKKT